MKPIALDGQVISRRGTRPNKYSTRAVIRAIAPLEHVVDDADSLERSIDLHARGSLRHVVSIVVSILKVIALYQEILNPWANAD